MTVHEMLPKGVRGAKLDFAKPFSIQLFSLERLF